MAQIPDYTEEEHAIVHNTNAQRWYKEIVEIQLADVEIQIGPKKPDPTECPAMFWLVNDCSFIIINCGETRYKCNFFNKEQERMGTGIEEYKDLQQYATTLLQIQADYESVRIGAFPDNVDSQNS